MHTRRSSLSSSPKSVIVALPQSCFRSRTPLHFFILSISTVRLANGQLPPKSVNQDTSCWPAKHQTYTQKKTTKKTIPHLHGGRARSISHAQARPPFPQERDRHKKKETTQFPASLDALACRSCPPGPTDDPQSNGHSTTSRPR